MLYYPPTSLTGLVRLWVHSFKIDTLNSEVMAFFSIVSFVQVSIVIIIQDNEKFSAIIL